MSGRSRGSRDGGCGTAYCVVAWREDRPTSHARAHRVAGPVVHGGLSGGQRVLIHGAGGGVESVAAQLARAAGTHVIATGRGWSLGAGRQAGGRAVRGPRPGAVRGGGRRGGLGGRSRRRGQGIRGQAGRGRPGEGSASDLGPVSTGHRDGGAEIRNGCTPGRSALTEQRARETRPGERSRPAAADRRKRSQAAVPGDRSPDQPLVGERPAAVGGIQEGHPKPRPPDRGDRLPLARPPGYGAAIAESGGGIPAARSRAHCWPPRRPAACWSWPRRSTGQPERRDVLRLDRTEVGAGRLAGGGSTMTQGPCGLPVLSNGLARCTRLPGHQGCWGDRRRRCCRPSAAAVASAGSTPKAAATAWPGCQAPARRLVSAARPAASTGGG